MAHFDSFSWSSAHVHSSASSCKHEYWWIHVWNPLEFYLKPFLRMYILLSVPTLHPRENLGDISDWFSLFKFRSAKTLCFCVYARRHWCMRILLHMWAAFEIELDDPWRSVHRSYGSYVPGRCLVFSRLLRVCLHANKVFTACFILRAYTDRAQNLPRQHVPPCDSTRGCPLPPRCADFHHCSFGSEFRRDSEFGGVGDEHLHHVHTTSIVLLATAMEESLPRLMGECSGALTYCSRAKWETQCMRYFLPEVVPEAIPFVFYSLVVAQECDRKNRRVTSTLLSLVLSQLFLILQYPTCSQTRCMCRHSAVLRKLAHFVLQYCQRLQREEREIVRNLPFMVTAGEMESGNLRTGLHTCVAFTFSDARTCGARFVDIDACFILLLGSAAGWSQCKNSCCRFLLHSRSSNSNQTRILMFGIKRGL